MIRRKPSTLHGRIRRARIEFSAMRWESAITIAATIIATPVTFILGIGGLIPEFTWTLVLSFGLFAEAAIILSSFYDPESGTHHISESLAKHFGVSGIRDEELRKQIMQALGYRLRMNDILGRRRRAENSAIFETVVAVDSWLDGISRLARRLDRFKDEASFQSTSKVELITRIDELECRANEASDNKVKTQLQETLQARRNQLLKIEELENLMERGELRLEHAVGTLGTIHSQVTIFAARGADAGDAARITQEISDEINQVDAVLNAMDRIYTPPKEVGKTSGASRKNASKIKPIVDPDAYRKLLSS